MNKINIRAFRMKYHMSQGDLANKLGIAQGYLSQIENGVREISDTVAKKFSEIIDKYDDVIAEEGTVKYSRAKQIPFYNTEVFATPSPGMDVIQAMQPEFYIPIPYFRDCDFAVRVSGDSMYPKYRHGDIIICKEIKERQFILGGEVYFVVTRTSGYRCLKYLHYNPEDENTMVMVSHNDKAGPPQPILKEDILYLYLVRGRIEV